MRNWWNSFDVKKFKFMRYEQVRTQKACVNCNVSRNLPRTLVAH